MKKISTKLMLTLALAFMAVGGVKAKTTLSLPGAWGGTTFNDETNTYTFGGSWNGAATWVGGDWSGDAYQYVWVKYSGFTGKLKMAIEYDEWTSPDWGGTFDQQSAYFADASGLLFIAIDKTTTFVKGSAETDGDHIGDIYAKHIRQIVFQDQGAASTLTIEGLYVGTYAEMLADMGYDVSKNHVLKVTNGAAGSNIWDKTAIYALPSALTTGKKYTVKAKICAADVTSGTVMKFVLTGGATKYGNEIAILANTFHEVSAEFTADANTQLELNFGFANGVVYIDDVSCVEEGTTTNLVSNSDFEEPLSTAGWSIPGWTGQAIAQAEQAIGELALLPQKATIGTAGYATIVAFNPLSVPAGVNAFFAKYDSETGKVKLTAVADMDQWGRAVISGDPGDYYFPQIEKAAVTSSWGDNGMEISWGDVKGDGSTIYALANKSHGIGFYVVGSGVTVPSGKPYLVISGGSAPEYLSFDEEGDNNDVTGIGAVEKANVENGVFYNLAGQRVAQPTKGLYIVNGKKVIIK